MSRPSASGFQYVSSKPSQDRKQFANQSSTTSVINIRKYELNRLGYKDLQGWLQDPSHVYIGRDMTHYIPGAVGSKWGNPFNVKKFGREGCCKKYKEHVLNTKELFDSLGELKGKTLGCWCHPEMCHGHMLAKLIDEHLK